MTDLTKYLSCCRQTVTLYLMVLPLVLVDRERHKPPTGNEILEADWFSRLAELKWKMVPFVTIIAFTLMGIEVGANSFGFLKSL